MSPFWVIDFSPVCRWNPVEDCNTKNDNENDRGYCPACLKENFWQKINIMENKLTGSKSRWKNKIVLLLTVVYFDQCLGAAHYKLNLGDVLDPKFYI